MGYFFVLRKEVALLGCERIHTLHHTLQKLLNTTENDDNWEDAEKRCPCNLQQSFPRGHRSVCL